MENKNQYKFISSIICFCELEGQKDKMLKGEEVELLHNTLLMLINKGESIKNVNWLELLDNQKKKLMNYYELPESWIWQVADTIELNLDDFDNLSQFCYQFSNSLNFLSEFLIKMQKSLGNNFSKKQLAHSVVDELFVSLDKPPSEDEMIVEINKLRDDFSLMKSWIKKFSITYLELKKAL